MYTTTPCECSVAKNCMRAPSHQYDPHTRQHLHDNTLTGDVQMKPSRRLESGDHRPETTEQRRDTARSHRDSEITLGNEPQ